jgi:hypothetical protein
MGLLSWVMAVDIARIVKVLRALAAQINGFAAHGDHGLTEIIIKVLLGICVGCIEFAQAGMGHFRLRLVRRFAIGTGPIAMRQLVSAKARLRKFLFSEHDELN